MQTLNTTNLLTRWHNTLRNAAKYGLLLALALTALPVNSAYAAEQVTPAAAVTIVGAPCSVVPNVLEDDQRIFLFPERLAYALPSDVTVTGTDGSAKVLPQGTVVDSYYLHADWVNNGRNTPKTFDGSATFAQPVYGIIKNSAGLIATHPILGAPTTTYSTNSDQGEEGYGDKIWFNDAQTLNLHFSVYNAADQVRVITAASSMAKPSGAIQVSGAPCTVVEGTLESDNTIRLFPERLNYVLPETITIDAQGAPGTVIPQGTKVNVYYVHADRVGDEAGVVKKLSGSVTFDSPILAVISNGQALLNTHGALGNTQNASVNTRYSASVDQGIDAGDVVTIVPAENRVDFAFDVWNVADQVRVITIAN